MNWAERMFGWMAVAKVAVTVDKTAVARALLMVVEWADLWVPQLSTDVIDARVSEPQDNSSRRQHPGVIHLTNLYPYFYLTLHNVQSM